jgi:hypothetical protein
MCKVSIDSTQIDQDDVRNAVMELQDVIGVELYRVRSMSNMSKVSMDSSMGLLKRSM